MRVTVFPITLARHNRQMKLIARTLVLLLGSALLPFAATAQPAYPSKPIHFVVPYPPGGPLDTVARLLGQKVSESLKQPVVVENKPGAGGNIGAEYVARSTPDGYSILMGAVATHAINPTLYSHVGYDPVRDFAPITQLASTPNVLVVNPSLPVHNVKDFIAYAKAHPGQLNFGSGSTGSAGHLAGELFNAMAGVHMVHIPYKGAGPAMQDLIAGQLQLMFDNVSSAKAQIAAGKVRAIALTTSKRSDLLPGVPTLAESGLADFDINTWFGVFAPAGTPYDIVKRLHDEFVQALGDPSIHEKMLQLGAEPVGNTPEQFAAYIKSEAAKYAKVIKQSGAKVD